MVYFAYGALGLIDVTRDFWVKESLALSPAELASIGVWLTLPWTVKMVFGELVDCVPILGSQRRAYILIGASCTSAGLVTLAGAAGQWIAFLPPHQLYVLGSMLIVLGTVIQDVVADAMSTEVVPRVDADGKPRPDADVRADLGMVQVLGRISLSAGILAVAGLSGVLAFVLPRGMVFLVALVVPAVSLLGVFLIKSEAVERRPIDWRILGGGLAFGTVVAALGLGGVPFAQEIIFVVSMGVVCGMLVVVTRELDHKTRMTILYAAIIIFAFRATPSVGDGYFWFSIDVLKFDEAFYGILRQTSAIISIVAMWFLAKQITEYSVAKTLFWIAVAGTILTLPSIGLFYGIHHWTEAAFWLRRPFHRIRRYRGELAVRATEHDSVADAHRLLRAGRTSRHLVRADGVVDESRAGRRPVADQVSQPDVRGRARRLRRARRAADHGDADRPDRSGDRDPALRPAGVTRRSQAA